MDYHCLFFEKSALSKMMEPILSPLGISLNRKATRLLTLQAAEKKIEEMKPHLQGRMVSIKTDLCTRRGRHFIGINIQTVLDGELKIITATVKEMTERATGTEIRKVILDNLQKFGIKEENIYTLTSDNGVNVVKAGEIMRQNYGTVDDDCNEEDVDDEISAENEESDYSGIGQLDESLRHVSTAADGVVSVRCAAHTLQLCVHDLINKNQNIKSLLTRVRKVVKKTHTQNMRLVFKQNKMPLPKLDCETRWGSSYEMLQSVMAGKTFLCQIGLANDSLMLPEDDWETIEHLIMCLKPVYDTTLAIQMRKLTAGMFLGEWLKCKLMLSNSAGKFSSELFSAMENREHALLDNAAFLAAIYIDPRFQCLLSSTQKDLAIINLNALWKRIMKLESTEDAQIDTVTVLTQDENEKQIVDDCGNKRKEISNKSPDDVLDQILADAVKE